MRIVYLIPSLDGSGGAERAIAGLVGPLTSRGVALDIVTFGGNHDASSTSLVARAESDGARVSTVPGAGRVTRIRQVRALVADRRPDLVHTTLFEADVAGRVGGRLARTPVVSSLVNVAYGPEQLANPALERWKVETVRVVDRATALGVRRFHALSPHVAEVMGRRLGIRADRIDVIPRGRDAGLLGAAGPERRAEVRERLGVEGSQVLVVAAARHEYQKGLDVLIDAWPGVRREIPGAVALIGGRRGNETPRLEPRIAAQGGDAGIRMLGARDDVPDLMVAADVFVVPSRWEGFGSILVEAMALGAPAVATRVGPVPEVVGEGWARLVAPDAPDELAAAIVETVRQDAGEAARRADAARARFASTFSIDVVADATVAFYERALG